MVRSGQGRRGARRLLLPKLWAVHGLGLGPRALLQRQSARCAQPSAAAPRSPRLLLRLLRILPDPFPRGPAFFRRADRLDRFSSALILNLMVKYQDATLDRTFAALADPTRRALLARLEGRDALSVSELAQPFSMSLPAIMKHLDVLSVAGLIAREKTGRVVACRLTAKPMGQAMEWLNRYQRFWSDNLERLAAFVEEETSW